ncbi:MAG: hypothetical protein JO179_07095 [Solirubrobacterales bacterium]|nr:hypothetical protein [Solirubrobacterales bacterium]
MVGAVLLVLLAVLGVTILRIGQLLWLHLFLGLVLLGPLALKMASVGYRFVRYYARVPAYREKGPPKTVMRLIAPLVLATTLTVFVSGIVLLIHGPRGRGDLVLVHKASFVIWLGVIALHVLGHLPIMVRVLRPGSSRSLSGVAGRRIALVGAIAGGLVTAIALIPDFAAWTAHAALHHHR